MKKILLFLLICSALPSVSQIYQSYNISLMALANPNIGDFGYDNRRYSGCWGWYQASKNKEYGICGTSNGTYFIDVTSPYTPTVSAFLQGAQQGTYREMKTYKHYCYIVSDDDQNKRFQIVDLQYLPDSLHVIYNDSILFRRGHTIWIDTTMARMYIGAMIRYNPLVLTDMAVFSLANPESPVLLRKLDEDFPNISYVHDMFVRRDTVFASCGYQGLYIFKYDAVQNKFLQLGSYTTYASSGYNHSSFLTKDSKYLVFCDEVPEGLPMHFVDVQNLSNIQPVKDWHPFPGTTPHNPEIKDDFIIVSCYQDGLQIYDVSHPPLVNLVGYFDTYPQGGANIGGDYSTQAYRGNWGNYPFLPSGIILANDMQNGMFILNASTAYSATPHNYVGIPENKIENTNLIVYPNPASDKIALHYNASSNVFLQVKNILGETILEKKFEGPLAESLDISSLRSGTYFISVKEHNVTKTQKIIINH